MERRSRRKRSRKASEREDGSEEPSPPPVKMKRRSSGSGGGKSHPTEERRGRGGSTRTRSGRGLRVSFDILENNLTVGEAEGGGGGGEETPCTLTLASTPETGGGGGAERAPRRGGNGAGPKDIGGVAKKPVEIKFKNNNFAFSYLSTNKKKSWKSYKQIVTAERALPWKPNDPTFSSLDAPPPLKPAKKYADLTGLTAKYRDPMSGLWYSSTEEFRSIRSLPPDIVSGYLALRGKMPIM